MLATDDLPVAQEITRRLQGAAGERLTKVLLHGSRVNGRARPSSDFDILVVLRDPVADWVSESMQLLDLFNDFAWPVDIQVFGESEYEELRLVPGSLAYPAATRGLVLYETSRRDPRLARSPMGSFGT